ncbi:MAG: DUF4332 domain-containing protein [Thermoplasmatota archaeon]
MRAATLRLMLLVGGALAILLFIGMLIDQFANDQGFIWPLVIAFVAVLLYIIVVLLLRPDERPIIVTAAAPPPAPRPVVFREVKASAPDDLSGMWYQVIDVEGIGPVYAERLQKAKIVNTQQLIATSTTRLAEISKAPPKTVQHWQTMAELMKVEGIGPQYAEALSRAGILGIKDLGQHTSSAIVRRTNKYLASLNVNLLGPDIENRRIRVDQVDAWKKSAADVKRMEGAGVDLGRLPTQPLTSHAARQAAARDAGPGPA